jgi:hypothetical protein
LKDEAEAWRRNLKEEGKPVVGPPQSGLANRRSTQAQAHSLYLTTMTCMATGQFRKLIGKHSELSDSFGVQPFYDSALFTWAFLLCFA